ncbi:MAG: glutathione synthase [Labilibaculum sp.]|nr:glutathione synthase [Labilibaculum sp.]MBI9058265.1 glutathione synthase [Labilibaculum sp.]
MMKICFIMYPWESLNPKQDSTIRLVHECVKREFDVAITSPQSLTIRDSVTLGYCSTFEKMDTVSASMTNFHHNSKFTKGMRPLKDFDVIFMRDNPPIDPLVLNFLDSIKDETFIMNAIDGLREANNKIYTAAYYDPRKELIPATHVSKNIDYLMKTIEESEDDKMILKPLDGYGGRGVIVIEKSAMHNIKSLLDFYINKSKDESNYVILQEYIEGAELGDVRVLMLNGKPIGAIRRVPAKGDARSNISAGGTVERYKLTKGDKRLCDEIGQKLVQDGIYFAGLDIIGSKLVEINVVSPGTITDINRLNNVKIQTKIIDYLETVVSVMKMKKDNFRAEDIYESN